MQFEEIFLEKADLQKFMMFSVLTAFDADSLTITELSAKIGISYQQTYNIFQELIEDVAAITGDSRATVKKSLMGPLPLRVTIDQYRFLLMEDAIAYQFVDYLVQGSRPSVDRFCNERYSAVRPCCERPPRFANCWPGTRSRCR